MMNLQLSTQGLMAIHEVKLLNGFYKGKTYFLIADELEKNFKQETEEDEKT